MQKKHDILSLAHLYMDQKLPYQSAKLLEERIKMKNLPKNKKNLSLLSEAFYQAREGKESLKYLKEAVNYAKEFKLFVLYGHRLLEQEQWMEAEKTLKEALKEADAKEVLENIKIYQEEVAETSSAGEAPETNHLENVYLSLGISVFYQKRYEEALDYFKKSIEVKDTLLPSYEWIELTEKTIEKEKKKTIK